MDNSEDVDRPEGADTPEHLDGSGDTDAPALTTEERRVLDGVARGLGAGTPLGRSLRTFTPPPSRRCRAAAAATVLAPLAVAPVLASAATAGPATLATAFAALPGAALLAGLAVWTLRGGPDR